MSFGASNHVLLGLPTGLLTSTPNSIHFFTQPSSPFLFTCPYHPCLPPLITVIIGSNSNQFSQLFTCPSVFDLIICISALSYFNPTSTSMGLVSLPKVMLLLTQLTYTRLQRGSSGCQKWQTPSELYPSISDSSYSSKMGSTISIKSVSQIAKTLYTSICLSIHQLDHLLGSFHPSPTPETVSYPRQVTMYSTSPLVNHCFTYCALTSGCLHSFPTDTT